MIYAVTKRLTLLRQRTKGRSFCDPELSGLVPTSEKYWGLLNAVFLLGTD
jgi:hypothetical protein